MYWYSYLILYSYFCIFCILFLYFCICIFVSVLLNLYFFSSSLSPPPPRSECTAQQAQEATGGRCIFASGTGFADVEIDGKVIASSQCNNRCVRGTNVIALIGNFCTFPWGSVLWSIAFAMHGFFRSFSFVLQSIQSLLLFTLSASGKDLGALMGF